MSMWSQSASLSIVSEQAAPSLAKSALRIDGAMTAGGPMFVACLFDNDFVETKLRRSAERLGRNRLYLGAWVAPRASAILLSLSFVGCNSFWIYFYKQRWGLVYKLMQQYFLC